MFFTSNYPHLIKCYILNTICVLCSKYVTDDIALHEKGVGPNRPSVISQLLTETNLIVMHCFRHI